MWLLMSETFRNLGCRLKTQTGEQWRKKNQVWGVDGEDTAPVKKGFMKYSMNSTSPPKKKKPPRWATGGEGWPNPKPHELLPLLRISTRQLPLRLGSFFFFVEVFFHPKKHAQVALFFWKKCPWKKTPLLNSMLGKFMVSLKEVYSHDIVYSHVFSVDY